MAGIIPTKVPWGQIATTAMDTADKLLPQKTEYSGDKGYLSAGLDQAYDQASDVVMQINPLVGGIMKANGLLSKGVNALGGGTDGMTTTDAILGSSFMQMTPLGLINGFGGSKSDTMEKDYKTNAIMGSSYQGYLANLDKAMNKQGKKYGFFSQGAKDDANSFIHRMGRLQNVLGTMADTRQKQNQILGSQMDLANANYVNDVNGTSMYRPSLKNGAKLFPLEFLDRTKKLLNKPKKYQEGGEFKFNFSAFEEQTEMFKEGGKMNVIPEGALHARKHEIFEESPELKGQITEKGIPVVVEKEGGEVEQQAEIESNEIIFIKEVTEKLEKYYRKYKETNDDKYAIIAGKLITCQIMENTDDKTGLIEEICQDIN